MENEDEDGHDMSTFGQFTGKTGQDADRGNAREAMVILGIIGDVTNKVRLALTEREHAFLIDMRAKLGQYGLGLCVTGRQLFYLRDVKDRLVMKGVI